MMLYSGLLQNHILKISIGIGTVVKASLVTFHILRKPKRNITRFPDTMEVLNKKSVHIKNRDKVEEILSQFNKGGATKLQVISDFDHTLSRVHKNGELCSTSYGIFKTSHLVSEDYKLQSKRLFEHYHPIEVDPNLTTAEKIPHMLEWYSKGYNLICTTSGVTKDCFPEMVSVSNACLREGCDIMFASLYKHNVPLLVFSAGLGDILKEVLLRYDLLYPNVKIIANFLHFDEKNKLVGLKNDLIHTFNKNQSSIENQDYFQHLKMRKNILLLGDSLGDLDMAEGVQDVNAILKIGFLNFKIDQSLPEYLDKYDIVLTDDQTMDVVVGLLQNIL